MAVSGGGPWAIRARMALSGGGLTGHSGTNGQMATPQPRLSASTLTSPNNARPGRERGEKSPPIGVVCLEGGAPPRGGPLAPVVELLDPRRSAQRGARGGHHQSCRQALAHDIAQRDDQVAVVLPVPVVEISTDLLGRSEVGGKLEPVFVERGGGQHSSLRPDGPAHLGGPPIEQPLHPRAGGPR